MSDAKQNEAAPKPRVAIVSQYIKDLSFEAPNSPSLFFNKEPVQANVKMNIDIKVKHIQNELFNVDLVLKVHNSTKEKSIFMVELVYGGLCAINVPEAEQKKELLVTVPQYLFPSVRALVARITSESGFPPFMMAPIDFDAMYQNKTEDEDKK